MKHFNYTLILVFICAVIGLNGCGYQLGLVGQDTSVKNVYCYTVINETRKPGLEMPMTNSIINAFHHAGTHVKIVSDKNEADTFLLVKLVDFSRAPARFNEADFLQQSQATLYADMYLYRTDVDPRSPNLNTVPERAFYHARIAQSATYFVQPNQPEGEQSIHPQLFDKVSTDIVNKIVERWHYKSVK